MARGSAGLALGCLVDVAVVQASTQMMKLSNVNQFTTSCNFCSCGCGRVATVREGKLITMEGDFDHMVYWDATGWEAARVIAATRCWPPSATNAAP